MAILKQKGPIFIVTVLRISSSCYSAAYPLHKLLNKHKVLHYTPYTKSSVGSGHN